MKEFEKRYITKIEKYIGDISTFEVACYIFEKYFELYLIRPFKLDIKKYAKASKAFNKNKRQIMRIILPAIQKSFTLEDIFTLLKGAKIKMREPEIFAELYDLIERRIIIPAD